MRLAALYDMSPFMIYSSLLLSYRTRISRSPSDNNVFITGNRHARSVDPLEKLMNLPISVLARSHFTTTSRK